MKTILRTRWVHATVGLPGYMVAEAILPKVTLLKCTIKPRLAWREGGQEVGQDLQDFPEEEVEENEEPQESFALPAPQVAHESSFRGRDAPRDMELVAMAGQWDPHEVVIEGHRAPRTLDQVVIEGHGAPRALDQAAIAGNDRMENVPLGVMHDANRPMGPCPLNLSLPLHPYVQARLPVGQSVNPLSVWQAGGLARGGISQGRGQEESRSLSF